MDNQREAGQKYWFKRRRYGWGWIPVSWQGWLTLVAFVGVVLWDALQLPSKPAQPSGGRIARFFIIFGLALAAFFLITVAKGPAPHWRWGKKPGDDPHEDF